MWAGAGVDAGTLLCQQAPPDLSEAKQGAFEAVPSHGRAETGAAQPAAHGEQAEQAM